MSADTTNDMTSGSPVRLILQFMIPVCLGNIFQQFYNVADSIVAGQFIGVNALAAIGSTGSLMFFVTGWLNGLSSGFAILVSQRFGAKRYDQMRHYVAMSIYLAAAFAIVMTVGLLILNEPILRMMNFSDEIMPDVTAYMGIIYAGLIVTAAYNSLAAFLRALGDSKSPLYFLIISAVINVVLDIAFIVCFGMGVEGCAYATVIAQGISAVLCFVYILKKFPILHLKEEDFRISFRSFGHLLSLGIPMGLQFSITAIGTIIVQGAVNVYGEIYMAGFAAAGKLQNIIATVFTAFGATIATFVGQNRGAGRMDRVKTGVKYTQVMILIWSVVTMALVFFFGKYMMLLFVSASERCSGDLLPHRILVLSFPRKYFPLQEHASGNGVRTGSHAGRSIRACGKEHHRYDRSGEDKFRGSLPFRSGGMDRSADSTGAVLYLYHAEVGKEQSNRELLKK